MSRALVMAMLLIAGLAAGHGRPALAARPEVVEVIKPFGAALRVAPAGDAAIDRIAACGEWLSVTGERDGWYQVYSHAAYYWVGGLRVADLDAHVAYDCSAGFTFQPFDLVQAMVPSGCLSVRSSPSGSAPFAACVASLHLFVITNGPREVEGEDWFAVWSEETGEGWVRARFLYPVA